jgi:hypothetical protein
MAGIQTLINSATAISFDRRPVIAQTMSRGQYLKTAERGARVWKFIVSPSPGWRWESYRDVIEDLDTTDRITEEQVSFASTSGMNWIMAYRGTLTSSELSGLTIDSTTSGTTFKLSASNTWTSTKYVFKKGDFIQPNTSRYPYTVTSDVLASSSGLITVPVNRGIYTDVTLTGKTIIYGPSVKWYVKVTKMPTWTLTPGRLIQWNDDFELTESLQ